MLSTGEIIEKPHELFKIGGGITECQGPKRRRMWAAHTLGEAMLAHVMRQIPPLEFREHLPLDFSLADRLLFQ